MLALLLSLFPVQDQQPPCHPGLDRVLEFSIPSDAPRLDGRGPAAWTDYRSEFFGSLHMWAESDADLALLVQGAGGETLAEDDDSGGGTTPYRRLTVHVGDVLRIAVARADVEDAHATEAALHLVAAPEADAALAAAKEAKGELDAVEQLTAEGRRGAARHRLRAAIDALLEAEGAAESEAVAGMLWKTGLAAWRLQAIPSARRSWGHLWTHRGRTLPPDHPRLLAAGNNLAIVLRADGDLPAARALFAEMLAVYERTVPEDDDDRVGAELNLAVTSLDMGDAETARASFERVVAVYERTLDDDHPDLLLARRNLGATLKQLGDVHAARKLEEAALASARRILPDDDRELVRAKNNLATTLVSLNELGAAKALQAEVVAAWERLLPPGHPDLLLARANLASTLLEMGETEVARRLVEDALVAAQSGLPENHPTVLRARGTLALTHQRSGDPHTARALEESILATLERDRPEDHQDILHVRMNLACTLYALGHRGRAAALMEQTLERYEGILAENHPLLATARMNLGALRVAAGDAAEGRALLESALEAMERLLPDDHPDLQNARANLALTRALEGDHKAARKLQERVLSVHQQTLPAAHPLVLASRGNLAITLREQGEESAAREHFASILDAYEATHPADHTDLLRARIHLAVSDAELGEMDALRGTTSALRSGLLAQAQRARTLAAAEAHELLRFGSSALPVLLDLDKLTDVVSPADLFELVETRRLVASSGTALAERMDADPDLARLRSTARARRAALGDLVASTGRGTVDAAQLHERILRLTGERDAAERVIREALAAGGGCASPVTVAAVAAALPAGSAAVGFLRHARERHEEQGERGEPVDHLTAFLVTPEGDCARVQLGPAEEIGALVEGWRRRLGAPIQRGVGVVTPEDGEREIGAALREKLLDPCLQALGDEPPDRLHVVLDDFLHLVPLDALPAGDGLVGDRVGIVIESSFARLIGPPAPHAGDPSLLALGAPHFDAEGEAADSATTVDRGSTLPERFAPLLQTGFEAQSVGELFRQAHGREPVVLRGEAATKGALCAALPGTSYVHVATHGWFAPESLPSALDNRSNRSLGWTPSTLTDRVTGFAPMTLCGLALAGANRGRDDQGRVSGILTAEELCSLDLSSCELAVLSACETNVGIRRAGQGIQSLQAALHSAGARTAITSLWKVDDAATRRLMELFYAYLWIEELPKARALWRAKRDLIAAGHPQRDWAGWVLSGDPD